MVIRHLATGLPLLLLASSAMHAQTERRDTLPASVVTGARHLQFGTGEILSTPESIRAVASPLGEGDPIRWIQNLPGVSAGADGTSASFVRGGNMGGNLITLDGVPVYGYSHVLGLTMVIPNDAVGSVSFAKGGFGGNQGNFSASHIAVSSKQPAEDKLHTDLLVNNFLAGGYVTGPLSEKVSYTLSGRISPLGPEYAALKGLMHGQLGSLDHFMAGVGDFYGKFHWKIRDGKTLTASALASLDRYGFNMADGSREQMGWDNIVGSVRYLTTGRKGVSNLTLSYNSYGGTQKLSNEFKGEENHFSLRSKLDEVTLSEDFERYSDGAAKWKMGARLSYADFRPGEVAGGVNRKRVLMASAYLQTLRSSEKVRLEVTLRPTVFRSDTTMFSLDINLKGKWQFLPFLAFEATADAMSQYYHTLEGLPVGWSMDLLVPSVSGIPAEQMAQGYAGLESVFGNHLLSVGVYAKWLDHVIYYKDARNLFNSGISSWQSDVDLGKGDSGGVELMYLYHGRDLQVQASATLSKSTRKDFREVNGGKPFHAPFDRRLVGSLTAQWKGFSASFIWQDGNWVNGRGERYTVLDPSGNEVELAYYSSVNNYQMPALVRLDVGYQRRWQRGRLAHELNIGVFNVLNHFNPFTIYYDTKEETWKELALVPILPNVSYRISF